MTALLIYFLEVIICSALFAGYYWLALRNGNFHRWNRLYINAFVVLSLIIPLLNIPIPVLQSPVSYLVMPAASDYVNYIATGNVEVTTIPVQSGMSPVFWAKLIFISYMFVTFILLIKDIISLVRIVRLKRNAEHIHTIEYDLYCTDDNTAPFTFFRTIFWRKDISVDSGEGRCMLRHELAHVSLGHSWDKALMQLVCCIFWINPFFLLLRRELELVHEFAADHESFGEGNTEELSSMILSTLYPNHYHDLTSRFYQSSIKRRIFMITKSKKSKMSIMRKISVIPVVIIALLVFSLRSETSAASFGSNNITEDIPQDKVTVTGVARAEGVPDNVWVPQNEIEEPILVIAFKKDAEEITAVAYPRTRKSPPKGVFLYNDVEVKPQFEQNLKVFQKYIVDNLEYPTSAVENGRMGEVIASFIINENGKVEDVEAEVSADPSLAKEVLRVLMSSPDWTPGKQDGKNVSVKCYLFTKFSFR